MAPQPADLDHHRSVADIEGELGLRLFDVPRADHGSKNFPSTDGVAARRTAVKTSLQIDAIRIEGLGRLERIFWYGRGAALW